ncbi:MAG TPA: tetratricopeptide repeat protein [Puia sp.]
MNEIVSYSNRLTKILYSAAAFSLLLAVFAGYLYQKATPLKLFSENYRSYDRHILRGSSGFSALKDAYSKGELDSVIYDFKASNSPVPEDYLLAGIAYLENKQPQKAIATFKVIIQKNIESNSDFFQEEAEYYLAMSYLDNQQPEKALPIFKNIQADKENRYNSTVSDWFMLKMKISVARK